MRSKYSFYNLIVSTLAAILVPIAGIIKVRLFVDFYGSDLNGLQITIAQVITFINICELAYSLAFRQLLFKPLSEDDHEEVLKIYNGAIKIFKITGVIVLLVGLIISLLFPYFAISPLDYPNTVITFLLLVVPYGISYFLMGPSLVVIADQKEYKVSIFIQAGMIIRMILMVIAIKLKMHFYVILLIEGLNIIISNMIARHIGLKNYPWLKNHEGKGESDAFSKKSRYAMVQRLSELSTTQTDNIVITAFMGYEMTSVFGTYSYLTDSISKITQSMVTSPMNSFGNLFNDKNANAYDVFKEFFNFTTYISTIVSVVIFVVMPRFVHIWMNQPLYEVSVAICLAFALNIFYITMRQPVIIARDTNGLYVNAKNNAYLLAISKIILSIILIRFYGLLGVILATTIVNWTVDFLYNPKLVYDNVFRKDVKEYYLMVFIRLLIAFIIGFIAYQLWDKQIIYFGEGIIRFVLAVMVLGVLIFIITSIIYFVLFKSFRLLINRGKSILLKRK